jgi:hypothetical protein
MCTILVVLLWSGVANAVVLRCVTNEEYNSIRLDVVLPDSYDLALTLDNSKTGRFEEIVSIRAGVGKLEVQHRSLKTHTYKLIGTHEPIQGRELFIGFAEDEGFIMTVRIDLSTEKKSFIFFTGVKAVEGSCQ